MTQTSPSLLCRLLGGTCLALVLLAGTSQAGTPGLQALAAEARKDSGKSRAAARAQEQHGGKVLSVSESRDEEGEVIYKVKLLLDSGRIKIVSIRG